MIGPILFLDLARRTGWCEGTPGDPTRRDGWNWSTKGTLPLPYRLPELLEDIASGYEVFIVEGEKKVDMLREQGVPATCNHGGAGKFPDDLLEWFKGAKVVILPDNDDAGRDHRDLVGRKLRDVAERVRTLDLPDLPPKGGVDDWLPAGGTAEQLYDLAAERAAPFVPGDFRSKFGAVPFARLGDPGPVFDYLIKGVLTKGEQSLLIGESQSGKSFVAIDMAMAIARGVEWFGRKTRRGGVIYQAGESAVGVRRRRVPAYMQHNGLSYKDPIPFVLLERPLDLYTNDEHVDQFIEECGYWASTFSFPLELITIDTFNKATPGANENDGKDMGVVLARCDRIRQATGAHVQLVHHLNASGTKARGHTSLFANVENVVTVRLVENSHDGNKRDIREWVLPQRNRLSLPEPDYRRDHREGRGPGRRPRCARQPRRRRPLPLCSPGQLRGCVGRPPAGRHKAAGGPAPSDHRHDRNGMTTICPCCGQEVAASTPVETLKELPFGIVERRIIEALADCFPRSLTMEALIERVWAGARKPENPTIIIRVRTHDLREKLPRYGWTIPAGRGGRGKPGLYKLEPVK